MAYDDVADAESLGDDDYYDDEYDDDEDEPEYLFGTIPRTPGLIAFAALAVVLILLLAALFSSSFGFVGGIDGLSVYIPGQEGDILDEKMDITATTETPAFGKNADGTGDLKIYYDGEVVYTGSLKFNSGRGTRTVPYEEFYVDNGEYTAEVDYEGFTERSDPITLKRTAHHTIVTQNERNEYHNEEDSTTYVRYQMTLFPDEDHTDIHDVIWVPGEGNIEVFYVDNEMDQDDEEEWETVMIISISTAFKNFEYQFPGEDLQNLSSNERFVLDFEEQKLLDQKGDGYYSFRLTFQNTYGLEDKGAFRDDIFAMPEDYTNSDTGNVESVAWLHLEDD